MQAMIPRVADNASTYPNHITMRLGTFSHLHGSKSLAKVRVIVSAFMARLVQLLLLPSEAIRNAKIYVPHDFDAGPCKGNHLLT